MSLLSFFNIPTGAMCWSVVCDCGIPGHTHLPFDFCSCAIDLKLLFHLVICIDPSHKDFYSEILRHANAYKSLMS